MNAPIATETPNGGCLKRVVRAVPCNGCTLCCKSDLVRILPGDPTDYWVEPHPMRLGEWMLAHKENGDCIYLGETGCTIHARRPQMCREMDCRILAQRLTKKQLLRMNGKLEVWERGKELNGSNDLHERTPVKTPPASADRPAR